MGVARQAGAEQHVGEEQDECGGDCKQDVADAELGLGGVARGVHVIDTRSVEIRCGNVDGRGLAQEKENEAAIEPRFVKFVLYCGLNLRLMTSPC